MREGRSRKIIRQIATLAVLMFATYYFIMRDKDLGSVWMVFVNSSKIWLLVSIASMALYVFCGGYAIRVLMQGQGRKITIWQCFKYSFVEFYFSAITPSSTGGQPAQVYYMGKDGFPKSDSTVILLAITVLYKGSFLFITAVLFILNVGFISRPFGSVWILAVLGILMNVGLISLLILLLFSRKIIRFLSIRTVNILGRLHIIKTPEKYLESIEDKVEHYHECAAFLMKNKLLVLKTFGVLTVQRLSLLMITFFVYKALGLTGFTLLQVLATQCLLNLCVDMLPLPGAVGISEAVFFMLFTPIFTEGKITTAVLLSRGISFYILVFIAGMVVIGVQAARLLKTAAEDKES